MSTRVALINDSLTKATTGWTKEFTESGFGIPDAAIISISGTNPSSTWRNDISFGIGFLDKDDNQGSLSCFSDHADVTGSSSRNVFSGTEAWTMPYGNNTSFETVKCTAEMIVDGIKLTNTAQGNINTFQISIILIKCRTAKLVKHTLAAGTGVQDITAFGFEPHMVFALGSRGNTTTYDFVDINFSFGVATNHSVNGITQLCAGYFDLDAQSTTEMRHRIDNTRLLMFAKDNGSGVWVKDSHITASAFDSSGFSVASDVSHAGDDLLLLGLEFDSEDNAWAGTVSVTTTDPDTVDVVMNPAFLPELVGMLGPPTTSIGGMQTIGNYCFGAATSTKSFWNYMVAEDNETTSDTGHKNKQYTSTIAADGLLIQECRNDADGLLGGPTHLDALNSDGFTIGYANGYWAIYDFIMFAFKNEPGQPTHRRWSGVPGMSLTGRRSW